MRLSFLLAAVVVGASATRVGVLSSYPPRECGIASYTKDWIASTRAVDPAATFEVIALVSPQDPQELQYAAPVVSTVQSSVRADMVRAGEKIGANPPDVFVVQHEFGLYGGEGGSYVVDFVKALRTASRTARIVVVFHSVVANFGAAEGRVVAELMDVASDVVVTTHGARSMLLRQYEVDSSRVHVIPHGAPVPTRAHDVTPHAGLRLVSYGFLSRNKGLELVLDAMPALLEAVPEATYTILGEDHPHDRSGMYRAALKARADALNISHAIHYRAEYLTMADVDGEFAKADVFVAPYTIPEQVSSGTLTYAVASGLVCVATPYVHAADLLAEGAGILVQFNDVRGLSNVLKHLAAHPEDRKVFASVAAAKGRDFLWPAVAAKYAEVLSAQSGFVSLGQLVSVDRRRIAIGAQANSTSCVATCTGTGCPANQTVAIGSTISTGCGTGTLISPSIPTTCTANTTISFQCNTITAANFAAAVASMTSLAQFLTFLELSGIDGGAPLVCLGCTNLNRCTSSSPFFCACANFCTSRSAAKRQTGTQVVVGSTTFAGLQSAACAGLLPSGSVCVVNGTVTTCPSCNSGSKKGLLGLLGLLGLIPLLLCLSLLCLCILCCLAKRKRRLGEPVPISVMCGPDVPITGIPTCAPGGIPVTCAPGMPVCDPAFGPSPFVQL